MDQMGESCVKIGSVCLILGYQSAVDEMNCLRRTTVFGAESTAVNTIRHAGKDDTGAVDECKENHTAVLAIQEEVLPLEYVESKILATPSRARERRDAPMSVTRTPGQREFAS